MGDLGMRIPARWCRVVIVILVLASTACAPSVRLRSLGPEYESRPENCSLRVYELDELVDVDFDVIGDVYVTDTGFTVSRCGKKAVRDFIRKEACRMGADAIEIYRESYPDFWSTCYRVKARYLVVDEEQQ